jgi:hypothetical protein
MKKLLFFAAVALSSQSAASVAMADCDIKEFIVKNVTSLQESGSTQLAFMLSASESQYENAKKSLDSGADVYGLFSGNLNYAEAKQKAQQIATTIKFDYESSYASSYLSQSVSGKALDDYVQCLQFDKTSPGLRLWVLNHAGKYYNLQGFWVGANTVTPDAKLDSPAIFDGGTPIGLPQDWVKGQTYPFAFKSEGPDGFYLSMSVGGQPNTLTVVPPPPNVVWLKHVVVSTKKLGASSTYSNPCTGTKDSDTIYPVYPGGYFVSGTRTTNHSTTDASYYSEKFTVDRPDQVSVEIGQSTGGCEHRQSASGQLEAVETYPQASP